MPDTSLGRALAELVDDVEAGDSLRARVARRERRGRRRPLLTVAAALLAVAVLGVGLFLVDRNDERPVVTRPEPTTTTTTTTTTNYDSEAFALWPVVTRNQLEDFERNDDLPSSPDTAAIRFAREVLGWRDPHILSSRVYDNSSPSYFRVEIESAEGDGTVVAQQIDSERYVVTGVLTWTADEGASVSVTNGPAYIGNGHRPPAGGSVEIILRKGPHEYRAAGLSMASTTFEGVDATEAGAVLVLYRNAAGVVVDAWGTSIPPGDFSAG
jgi:hypothetical protein